jgi:hypothetical protein
LTKSTQSAQRGQVLILFRTTPPPSIQSPLPERCSKSGRNAPVRKIGLSCQASSYRQRFRSGNRFVNPDFAGKGRWFGSASYETLRVALISNIEHVLALPQDVFRLTRVNRRGRQQAYPGVTVLSVVPAKKILAESTTVLNAPKAVRGFEPTASWSRTRDKNPPKSLSWRQLRFFGPLSVGQVWTSWNSSNR